MALSNDLTSISKNLLKAYDAIEEMGGTLPQDLNVENLVAAIESIESGKVYLVSFDSNGGVPESYPDQRVLEGKTATKPEPDPQLPDSELIFAGWFREGEVPDVGGPCPVMFRMDGGSPQIATQQVSSGGKATRPATVPTKENFKFLDWYLISEMPEETPGWIPVIFNIDGGSGQPETQFVYPGEQAKVPTPPSRPDHEFLGWFKIGEVPDDWYGKL